MTAMEGILATGVAADGPSDGGNDEIEKLIYRLLELLGEDPERDGLRRTPQRVASALQWLTRGYRDDLRHAVGTGVFEEHHESMVMVRGIEVYSLCEHHMLPFYGEVHLAYIPDGRIIGLSKLARLVETFARRLQVQERLTEQIAQALCRVVRPRGVAVLIEAKHLCMMMRGVEKQSSTTVTRALRGVFTESAEAQEAFLRLTLNGR